MSRKIKARLVKKFSHIPKVVNPLMTKMCKTLDSLTYKPVTIDEVSAIMDKFKHGITLEVPLATYPTHCVPERFLREQEVKMANASDPLREMFQKWSDVVHGRPSTPEEAGGIEYVVPQVDAKNVVHLTELAALIPNLPTLKGTPNGNLS